VILSKETPAESSIVKRLEAATQLSAGTPNDSDPSSNEPQIPLSFKQIVRLAQKKVSESSVEQQLVPSLPSNARARVRSSMDVHNALVQIINDGLVDRPNEQVAASLQELKDNMNENNELASRILELVSENNKLASENNTLTTRVINLQEAFDARQEDMMELQIQALDRLGLLQNDIKALLTQTHELHEYPIPRLFIVLPEDSSSWNPTNLFSNKFRLYFLCECGEHTMSNNSKIPHHIHLAKHEGYEIARPNEFFRHYGSYVLTILRMLKFGMSVTGIVVPAVSLLVRDDAFSKATSSLKMLIGNIGSGMDQVIRCIEHVSANEGLVDGNPGQMNNNEALEGADLRQLETFLRNKDKNRVLGDLYRIVTTEGHVRWVCIDHYRENYHEKAAKAFRDFVLGMRKGWIDENTGRVDVELDAKTQDKFYQALQGAKSVYEFKVTFDWMWNTTQSDFKKLRDALTNTNVGVLEIDLNRGTEPPGDILNRIHRYDPIIDLMRHRSVRSVILHTLPENFVKRSSLPSRKNDIFSNLRHLEIDIYFLRQDIPGLKCLVSKAPNLSRLTLNTVYELVPQVYSAIAEHQKYPVVFKAESLCILQPISQSQATTKVKDTAELLKVFGGRIERVRLSKEDLQDSIVVGLARAIKNGGSVLKELILDATEQDLSAHCVKFLAFIVARSKLRELKIEMNGDQGRVAILEAIQWEHLRKLDITMKADTLETSVMRVLVDGMKKMSGRTNLEEFCFGNTENSPLTNPGEGLLLAFLSSTPFRKLQLGLYIPLEEILDLLPSIDFSRMQELRLWALDVNSGKVNAILESLQHATELRFIGLWQAKINDSLQAKMKAKGIRLSKRWSD